MRQRLLGTQAWNTGAEIPKGPSRCFSCGLHHKCISPRMPVHGKGSRGILIIGEAPGAEEDRKGVPFVGDSGKLLRNTLSSMGINAKRDCWITNAVICRPPKNKTPSRQIIEFCQGNLWKTIRELNPTVIVTLGSVPTISVIEPLWRKGSVTSLKRWAGWQIPSQKINAWVCPTYHPAYILRSRNGWDAVAEVIWKGHLRDAIAKTKRPWKEPPNYERRVRKIFNTEEAAKAIASFKTSESIAFDYETNAIKPDGETIIVCCSVSDGKRTIAFPWTTRTAKAMKVLLKSPVPKIGCNIKYEERWTMKHLGCRVRNWKWDTMIAAHIENNTPGTTSLKFQAFVRLGVGDYAAVVKADLDCNEGKNQVDRIDMADLLLYCGMDSLITHKLAQMQMKGVV